MEYYYENSFKDTRVLITGGAGFIGSHLADRLLQLGSKVIVIDNLDEYYTGKINNIGHNLKNPNYTFIKLDILNPKFINICKNVDIIFHLAAQPGVRYSFENPLKTNLVNTSGTLNVLTAAKKYNVKRVIFASSSSVYGIPKYVPVDEQHPQNPISIYGVSKLTAETYCKVFYESMKLPITILRYHTVYGPRQRPDMAIYKWTEMIFKGKPPIIYGDGNQTRDFTFVDDIVEGTLLAAMLDDVEGEIFNLGSGVNVTVNDVVNLILKIIGRNDLQPIHEPSKLGDVPDTCADISKAKKFLNYQPKTQLKDGLERFVEWFKHFKLS
ncbi:MAG: GDP-mannose 4,6-dehydratase [Nitrososphaerota archaeon]|nr:GDP-mannose 4,6-dehydratase [Nitrososphaerota archaeon]